MRSASRALACRSASKRDPALLSRRRLKLFKKAIFGGVPIGTDWDPARVEIPKQLEALSSILMGSRFGAYSHPCNRGMISISGLKMESRLECQPENVAAHFAENSDPTGQHLYEGDGEQVMKLVTKAAAVAGLKVG